MASYTGILYQNGVGIPGVHAVLYTPDNIKVQAVTTEGKVSDGDDSVSGRYQFLNINPGQYQVRFFGEGFTEENYLTIDVAGSELDFIDGDALKKDLLLQDRLSKLDSIFWCSRGLIDVLTSDTEIIRSDPPAGQNSAEISDGKIRVPATGHANTSYYYYTDSFETSITGYIISGLSQATVFANYELGSGSLKIETNFDGGATWYTWLDTSQTGSGADYEPPDGNSYLYRLGQQKDATTHFIEGTKLQIRAIITTGSDNTGGAINDLALYTGPDLFLDD